MKNEITQDLVRELLDYNPKTGAFLWRPRDLSWFKRPVDCKAWNARYAGKRAGGQKSEQFGYTRRYIAIFGVLHYEHRVAWIWMKGSPVPEQIDHINRDATDNRWINLRASNNADNHRNLSRNMVNTSGITGVGWHERAGKWRARVKLRGQEYHLGIYDAMEDAAEAVRAFRALHGFDPSHGSSLAHYHQ
ncbi:HNH endonuclease [Halomonas sp. OfavH-34-E]|uniref:HNH endonuclease n=1 Tax=Halomonas sp. OfavH-34-E TaxID=2954491 RepID=UPI002096C450|nr:HNH endonuclease [Halomonas sp. OfavH-34-E]MCO7217591.1 HNH endonuclease [Halomonas sp. OfavH-34-E]